MIDLEKHLKEQYGNDIANKAIVKKFIKVLKHIIHEDEINEFLSNSSHLHSESFVEELLDFFNFRYSSSNKDRENIPHFGRAIIVANHPIGSLDGIALLKLLLEIRSDVKIVVNRLLYSVEPLRKYFIPIDNMSHKNNYRQSYQQAVKWLAEDHLLVIFPAGEVSRLYPTGIKDGKWLSGFISFAKKTKSSITPIYIDAKNSKLFYSLSLLFKPFGTMMLPHEMFNKKNCEIRFKTGKTITYTAIDKLNLTHKKIAKLIKKQTYSLGRKKSKDYIETMSSIAHPQNRQLIKSELKSSELLGTTTDGKKIYLLDYDNNPNTIREVGRLRELSFRLVEEGTGKRLDIDNYDKHYKHLVLWDDEELEIVGSYRLGLGDDILKNQGINGFYSATLFTFTDALIELLPYTIDTGRSFIQPKYWGLRGLDYLWTGIGAFLYNNPNYQYMIGPVTMSSTLSEISKNLIADFYTHYFGANQTYAVANNRFHYQTEFAYSEDYKADFRLFNQILKEQNNKLPMLYKQYSELCDDKGTQFLDFGIDYDFADCIDGLILVDVSKMSPKKRARDIEIHRQ